MGKVILGLTKWVGELHKSTDLPMLINIKTCLKISYTILHLKINRDVITLSILSRLLYKLSMKSKNATDNGSGMGTLLSNQFSFILYII